MDVKIYSNCVDLASEDDSLFELILALEAPYSPRLKVGKLDDFSGTGDAYPIKGFYSLYYGYVGYSFLVFLVPSSGSSPQIAVFRRSFSTGTFGLS